jgi:hypothetical protein
MSDVPFIDVVSEWAEHLTPLTYVQLFAEFIARTVELPDDKIQEVLEGFYPARGVLEILKRQSKAFHESVRSKLRPFQRIHFDYAIGQAARDAAGI